MNMPRTALLTLAALTATASAATLKESLDGTELPHTDRVLPAPGTPDAASGYILRLSSNTLAVMPAPEPGLQPGVQGVFSRMRTEKTGDVFYAPTAAGGMLVVISGKVTDLGEKYLYQCAGKDLPKPKEWPADPAKGMSVPGMITGVKEGNTYLIETVDGTFALLRVISRGKGAALVQYVYQSDGSSTFTIAKSPTQAVAAETLPAASATPSVPAPTPHPQVTSPQGSLLSDIGPVSAGSVPFSAPGAAATPAAPATAAPQPPAPAPLSPHTPVVSLANPAPRDNTLMPYLGTHLRQRAMLIDARVKIIQKSASTPSQIGAKTDAIEDLGILKASEAVDTLLAQITFMNSRTTVEDLSAEKLYPAVGALAEIGKPASLAALKMLRAMPVPASDADETSAAASDAEFRAALLGRVVRDVEGADVGEYMLKRDQAQAEPSRRHLYDVAIKGK